MLNSCSLRLQIKENPWEALKHMWSFSSSLGGLLTQSLVSTPASLLENVKHVDSNSLSFSSGTPRPLTLIPVQLLSQSHQGSKKKKQIPERLCRRFHFRQENMDGRKLSCLHKHWPCLFQSAELGACFFWKQEQMMLMGVLKTNVCVSPADCQKKNMLGIKRFKVWCVIWLCVKNCWFRVMWQHRPRNVSAESRNARTWVPLRVVPNYFQLGWKQGYIIFRCRNSTDSLCVLIFF